MPVFGALAYLDTPAGELVRNGLTDERGRALFVGVAAGAYRVRVEMIGMATVQTDVFEVAEGMSVSQDLRLSSSAIELEGISVEVIDLRTIYPWDTETVLSSVEKTGRLVVAHEDHLSGGVGAEIVATVTEQGAYLLETPPVRVAHMDVFWGPTQLEPYSTISADRISAGIRRAMRG